MLRKGLKIGIIDIKIFKVRILIQKYFQPIVTSELCIFIERQFKPVHTIVLLPYHAVNRLYLILLTPIEIL